MEIHHLIAANLKSNGRRMPSLARLVPRQVPTLTRENSFTKGPLSSNSDNKK